ncbi:MAG: hypothetical protein IT480_16655 [Gammaproteobacteria bacterium]|nr:hypothetical protein [Gammaproteobacteria bacterium]
MAGVPQELLLNLYGGVTDHARWRDALDRVCRDLGVRSAVVQRMHAGSRGVFETHWLARDSYSEENSSLHDALVADAVNPRMRMPDPPARRLPASLSRDSDYPQMQEADGRRFQEALRSIGLGEFLSCGTDLPDGDGAVIVVHRRTGDARGFGADEERYLEQLAAHVRQAMLIAQVIEAERAHRCTLGAVVDRMRFGVITCDAAGRVSWISQQAQELVASSDALTVRNGRVACSSEQDALQLRRMLAVNSTGVMNAGTPGWAALGTGSGEPVFGLAVPLGSADKPGSGCRTPDEARIALFLNVPGALPPLDPAVIGRLLGLTPAEARLAAAICEGVTVREYARRRQVAEGTVRFQLKQVLGKTGSARQSELVRKICASVATALAPAREQ